jgi:hypothetical protein
MQHLTHKTYLFSDECSIPVGRFTMLYQPLLRVEEDENISLFCTKTVTLATAALQVTPNIERLLQEDQKRPEV